MSFNKSWNFRKRMFPTYEEIIKNNSLIANFNQEEDNFGFMFRLGFPNDPGTTEYLEKIRAAGISASIETYTFLQLVKDGPKIYRPQRLNFESLENMKMNVDLADYVQPFDTIVIELPEDYTRKRIAKNPVEGCNPDFPEIVYDKTHQPDFVILTHLKEENTILIAMHFDSMQIFSFPIYRRKDDMRTIEEIYNYIFSLDHYEGTLPIDKEEMEITKKICRAALNCVLVMEEFGSRKIGPDNPSHYSRLQRQKKGNVEQEIRLHPMIYEFDQKIKLYQEEKDTPRENGEGGWTLKPHWRSGHYRVQHYGAGGTLKKRIRIAAVLVNKHLYGGENKDTSYEKTF